MANVYWLSEVPIRCQVCEWVELEESFYDANIRGQWGLVCAACHAEHGRGVGTGRAQRYQRQPDGRYLKTAG